MVGHVVCSICEDWTPNLMIKERDNQLFGAKAIQIFFEILFILTKIGSLPFPLLICYKYFKHHWNVWNR